jgi:hypothetical protein
MKVKDEHKEELHDDKYDGFAGLTTKFSSLIVPVA